ncbi:AraC family transcriptional regulator [Breoghania sp. L-A4]|uniref:AraC family transcriptional regulator n=1 Tax=Breoghania sp. L-A4 TaxID=2304600 RepID=UPI000E3581DC|nr:AraC family transcriptional regulator [Breoghania sp. L-A4]AXS39353.1 AraC family transcriptional regulator [Breoghania sp. L-A4]
MDPLSDILSHMQLAGTLYFRTSFTSPWSVRVPAYANVARFHFAHKGRCLVRIDPQQPPVHLDQGDLLIIMRGAAHTLYCDPSTENQAVLLDQVVEDSGFTGRGALVYGEPGTDHETQLICGHFTFAEAARHPLIDALEPSIHIRNYGEAAGAWMENTLKVIGHETGRDQLGGDLIAIKMSEIIFAQALRAHLRAAGAATPVLAGFADPSIARALAAIHGAPGEAWTLDKLARVAGMSRTAFANRFTSRVTMTPLGYLTHWRMQIARRQLTQSRAPIIEIAEQVGYRSEAAFGRVFKKHHAKAPATYRRMAQEDN